MPTGQMHPDEVAIDVDLVQRLISTAFPDWGHLPLEPVPSTGTVNALYRLGQAMVVRLPRVARWADDLRKEIEWLPQLAPRLPLAVPTPLATSGPAHGYPFHWAVYRWLPGNPLSDSSGLDLGQIGPALVGFITRLRDLPTAGAPHSTRDRPLTARDGEVRQAVAAIGATVDARATIAAWEESIAAAPWTGPPVWTHGDLLPPNLLIEDGRLTGVVDFGNMGVGDPAVDLVPAWTVLPRERRQEFRSRLPADHDTWLRARGLALHQAVMIIPYYAETNPQFAAGAVRTVEQVLADLPATR